MNSAQLAEGIVIRLPDDGILEVRVEMRQHFTRRDFKTFYDATILHNGKTVHTFYGTSGSTIIFNATLKWANDNLNISPPIPLGIGEPTFNNKKCLWEGSYAARAAATQSTYFITAQEHAHLIKIGKGRDVNDRLSGLQVGNPFELKVLCVLRDNLESALHDYFAQQRHRGEWFHRTTEIDLMMDYITANDGTLPATHQWPRITRRTDTRDLAEKVVYGPSVPVAEAA